MDNSCEDTVGQIELYEAQYQMQLRGGGDIWRLNGRVFNHPKFENGAYIQPSAPVSFDEDTETFKTASGNSYRIMSYIGNSEAIRKQIREDVARGGYEIIDMPTK